MDWQVTDADRAIWDRELAGFVPPRVFDAHTHLYRHADFDGPPPALAAAGQAVAGWDEFLRQMDALMPGVQFGGLCFGWPAPNVNFDAANRFLADEVQAAREAKLPVLGQMLVRPEMDADWLREEVRRGGFVGLKVYHVYADCRPTWEAPIEAFLTEPHMQVAHDLGLSVTLHMVRSRALADPANQATLQRYDAKFPNARLILAHAARGFNPHHTIEGIESLRGLGSIWFDTSAVTDSGAYEAIIRTCGYRRLLYGADFPVSHLRGRCVALGDSFLWLSPVNTNLQASHADVQFSLVGLESLRSLKVAALGCGLSDEQVEAVFLDNARQLYGV